MKAVTEEWLKKAEGDYDAVLVLRRSRKRSRYDPICFHCQQCIEKYLKARLVEAGKTFPKIHDLAQILSLVTPLEPLWEVMRPKLKRLSDYAVLTRYPGYAATASDARDAYRIATEIRSVIRSAL